MFLAAYILEKKININPEYVGLGIMLHGVYDLLIYYKIMPYTDHAPEGYALACAVADVVMGGAAYFLWKKK